MYLLQDIELTQNLAVVNLFQLCREYMELIITGESILGHYLLLYEQVRVLLWNLGVGQGSGAPQKTYPKHRLHILPQARNKIYMYVYHNMYKTFTAFSSTYDQGTRKAVN